MVWETEKERRCYKTKKGKDEEVVKQVKEFWGAWELDKRGTQWKEAERRREAKSNRRGREECDEEEGGKEGGKK